MMQDVYGGSILMYGTANGIEPVITVGRTMAEICKQVDNYSRIAIDR